MLIATVQWHQWDFYIDMSRAFDTIKQGKALEVLNMAGCNDDDHHLVWVLLVNTHLTIGVKGTQSAWFETSLESPQGDSQSAWFETSLGSPQGDSLFPVLFTCYLAAVLCAVWESTSWLNPRVSDLGNADEKENNGKAVHGNEHWCNDESLGHIHGATQMFLTTFPKSTHVLGITIQHVHQNVAMTGQSLTSLRLLFQRLNESKENNDDHFSVLGSKNISGLLSVWHVMFFATYAM